MRLDILGSNSRGNGYVLQNDDEALIIECGCKSEDMLRAIDWHLQKVTGAVVSHRHNDHAGYIKEYLDKGINVLALPDVFSSHNLSDNICSRPLSFATQYVFGNFVVQAFSLEHDVPCVGFIINHPEIGKMMFCTDTYFIPYRISGLNNIMIEANYDDEILDRRIESGAVPEILRKRLLKSHMEIMTTIKWLLAQDLSDVDNIILIHLSDGSSDACRFKKWVTEATGKPVYCADSGKTIYLTY